MRVVLDGAGLRLARRLCLTDGPWGVVGECVGQGKTGYNPG